MKKESKVTKRLTLHKETVKVLTDEQLTKVAGGEIYTKLCTVTGRPCCS